MSEQRAQGDTRVDGLAFVVDGNTPRLDFPHAQIDNLHGEAGGLQYGAAEVTIDKLSGRFEGIDWSAQSASTGKLWVRDRQGRFEMTIERVELPHGIRITRAADGGIELLAPHASLSEVKLVIPDLDAFRAPPADPPASRPPTDGEPAEPRQGRLRFLDAVNGVLAFRIAVVLDLPVIGKKTVDQTIRMTVEDGAFDFKQLEDGLDWIEDKFLDIGLDDGRFRVGWGVPLFGSTKEIISWTLDPEATAQAVLGRIPLRALADFRMPGDGGDGGAPRPSNGKKDRLRSLTIGDIDIQLSMVAPRNLEVAGGTVRFGGEDEPGIVDLRVTGALVHPPAPGAIKAAAGAVDMTIKDVRIGGLQATADRLTVGPVDALAVSFDGFQPRSLAAVLHRVTATNLSLTLGNTPAA